MEVLVFFSATSQITGTKVLTQTPLAPSLGSEQVVWDGAGAELGHTNLGGQLLTNGSNSTKL